MRWKIILVNGGIVLVLSLLSFFLVRSSLETAVSNQGEQRRELARALQAANSQLEVDALRLERWLAVQVLRPEVASVFAAGTQTARSDAATTEANGLRDLAIAEPEFTRMGPSLVLLTDADGIGVGRNGSGLMRGDAVGAAYPDFLAALKAGRSGHALWVSKDRQEQMLVGYAPVRDTTGAVVGSVVLGVPMNDDTLKRASELTSGKSLALVAGTPGQPVAKTSGIELASAQKAAEAAKGGTTFLDADEEILGVAPFAVSGSNAVLVGSIAASRLPNLDSFLWPLLAVGGLGLLLVAVGGVILGNYISKPISEIEEGLLLVMNGQQDLRFDLEHDELGGLTSRINALLNTLLEVQEEPSSPDN